jgi:hypothetical protein
VPTGARRIVTLRFLEGNDLYWELENAEVLTVSTCKCLANLQSHSVGGHWDDLSLRCSWSGRSVFAEHPLGALLLELSALETDAGGLGGVGSLLLSISDA